MDNKQSKKYRVGYIDEESVWVSKFLRTFKDSFEVVIINPANKSLDEILREIIDSNLDCLIADFELKETEVVPFNGDEIIEKLTEHYPYFPVFIITSKEESDVLSQVEDNDIVRLKDELTDKPGILAQRINNKISTYYKDIQEAENTIKELVLKKEQGGLSVSEEELLAEKYHFLTKISPEDKIIPDSLIDLQNSNQLSEFVAESRLILEELKKLQK